MGDRDKDMESVALRHRTTVLQRQLGNAHLRFSSADQAFLAAVLHRLPADVLRRTRLLVRAGIVLRWSRSWSARTLHSGAELR
ncbi:hypothetical protein [Saccharothrix stipae]